MLCCSLTTCACRKFPERPLAVVTAALAGGAGAALLFLLTAGWGAVWHGCWLLLAGAATCGTDSLLSGSVSLAVGGRAGRAAATTSFVNGVGGLAGVLEGPLVGWLAAALGWAAVFPLLILFIVFGTLASYSAHTTDIRIRATLTKDFHSQSPIQV